MNSEFFKRNRMNLLEKLEDNSVAIFFAGNAPHKSADEDYSFTPNRNFFYLTGIDRENIILVLTKSKDNIDDLLFIEETDPVKAKWVGEKIKPAEASEASGIEKINYIDDFENELHNTLSNESKCITNLYMDFDRMKFEGSISRIEEFAQTMRSKYPYLNIMNASPIIKNHRTIKAKEEVELIKRAIDITREGIENIMNNAKPGMMEYEMEAYFDFTLKSKGAKDFAFKTIAASGINATILHYVNNDTKVQDDELILFDLGAQYKYYNADITRTFPVNGRFTPRQRQIYEIVLKAQNAVINMIRPGVPYRELNRKCREVLAKECIEIGLIKNEEELSKYYFHNVSHYLGLDTHDVGSREAGLSCGMIVTVEPGLYIEEERIGIRIEDDVLVTPNGCEVLSKDIIKSVDDIEQFMNIHK